MTKALQAAYVAVILILCVPVSAGATSRIKDLANIEGVRQNQLIGYGLVVGLNGTGSISAVKRSALATLPQSW
jgi:flagellar P-ring protein precursor FlgI